jgi:hypothetical protein
MQHVGFWFALFVTSCNSQGSPLGPGCLGAQGEACPSEGTQCPGGGETCVSCGPGLFTVVGGACVCSGGTWNCQADAASRRVGCPAQGGPNLFSDPNCTVTVDAGAPEDAGSGWGSCANLPSPSTGSEGCYFGRTYLNCNGPNGGCSCLADGGGATCSFGVGLQCPSTCSATCSQSEYAAVCEGPAPTANCSIATLLPSGAFIYCCSCN